MIASFLRNRFCMALCLLIISAIFVSCEEVTDDPPQIEEKNRTLLIYIAGNNNLSSNGESNLANLSNGYIPEDDGYLVVYKHTQTTPNPLLLNYRGENGVVVVDTVYTFPATNSSTAAALKSALSVTKTLFPAKDYGLVLWSHGTGWLPQGAYSQYYSNPLAVNSGAVYTDPLAVAQQAEATNPVKLDLAPASNSKSFGSEGDSEIDIIDLANALPYKLSFIIFDACFMGGIEVAYQLKDSTDYIIFSPAEIMANGFPYNLIAEPIFKESADLQRVAEVYYNHYLSIYTGQSNSSGATISLIKTDGLEALAEECRTLFTSYREQITAVNKSSIQGYFRSYNVPFFFDFKNFMETLAGNDAAVASFNQALDNVILYKASTPSLLNLTINSSKYSGISTYIPNYAYSDLIAYYKTLAWNISTGMVQ